MFVYKFGCSAEMGVRKSKKKQNNNKKEEQAYWQMKNFTGRFKYSQSTS